MELYFYDLHQLTLYPLGLCISLWYGRVIKTYTDKMYHDS